MTSYIYKKLLTPSTLLILIVTILLSSCQTAGRKDSSESSTGGADSAETIESDSTVGVSEQPDEQEDPYFTELPTVKGEVLRILITGDSYLVKQVSENEKINRRNDPAGDREQLGFFREFAGKYNFKDWQFDGMIKVRVNPETRFIEHIEYVPGQSPRTWQVSQYFQEDVSRFRFDYPGVEEDSLNFSPQEFIVRYRWTIKKEEGLSPEEAKSRAIEFLKNNVR